MLIMSLVLGVARVFIKPIDVKVHWYTPVYVQREINHNAGIIITSFMSLKVDVRGWYEIFKPRTQFSKQIVC